MSQESPFGELSRLRATNVGVFRGHAAAELGATRRQVARLLESGIVTRVHPDTYRMSAVVSCPEPRLRAARLGAGPRAAATGQSGGEVYRLQSVFAP